MKHFKAIVFDLYGTLCDVHSVAVRCESHFPGRGREISALWRQKQLEYTWLRSLMEQHTDFERATHDALAYVGKALGLDLGAELHGALCEEYLRIRPFPEVPAALAALKAAGCRLAILSNGSVRSIDAVVRNAGLLPLFDELVSIDGVSVFKPHRKVYALAEERLGLDRGEILFVSSNAWDATGAKYYGYPVCWVNRAGNVFEEMGRQPDMVVSGLDELAAWNASGAAA